MRRVVLTATIVLAFMVASSATAQAVETQTHGVSGSFLGSGTLDFGGCAGDAHISERAEGTIAPFGFSTLSFDFCSTLVGTGFVDISNGTLTIEASDGTVSATLGGVVDPFTPTPSGFPYDFEAAVTAGTGRYAGATGSIGLSGFFGLAAETVTGTASGSISFGAIPTTKSDCKNGGWRNVTNTNEKPFVNQGSCIAFVNRSR